jgi:hypothetical protein
MPVETVPIARVPLARSARRLLAAPLLALLVGVAAVAAALVLGGWAGVGLGLAGLLTVGLAAWLGMILVTIRLDVEVSSIRFHWPGGERRYGLVRGPVTRVALDGPKAVPLRAWFGAFGWTIGRATLRREERIEIVRLAPTSSLILVPTDGIRVAVAPRSEQELIAALTAAARVQQRLDAVRPRLPLPVVETRIDRVARIAPVAPTPLPERLEPAAPRVLTGIERVELEQRLAGQRAAALAAAEAERQTQEAARIAGPVAVAPAARRGAGVRRIAPSVRRPAWTRPSRGALAPVGVLVLPVIGAAIAWGWAVAAGHDRGASASSLVLALVLAGPAATLGAVGTRIWWPRLVPIVVTTSLFALVLVAGALIGPR